MSIAHLIDHAFLQVQQFAITQLYIKADTTVATDGGKLIYWQEKDKTLKPSGNSKRTPIKNPEDHIIATADLSGCTVVIVSSPFVALMAHVWERRDEDTWLLEPKGKDQKAKDAEFIAMGEKLLDGLVTLGLGVGASKANQYNGWLPSVSTTVHVVAPASNPDYDNNLGNPWYTYITEKGLIYEDAAKGILSKAAEKFGVPMEYAELHTYRRRYSTDPDHGLDDRDKIVLVPYIYNGHTYVNMMWDDNKLKPIAQIN